MGSSVLLKCIMVIERRDLELKRVHPYDFLSSLKHKRQIVIFVLSCSLIVRALHEVHGFDSQGIQVLIKCIS